MTNSNLVPSKPTKHVQFIPQCTEYGEDVYKRLAGNRDIDEVRLKPLAGSMKTYGFISVIFVIKTKAFSQGKKWELYICDGEHRKLVASLVQIPYKVEIIQFVNKEDDNAEEVTKLMAAYNSEGKNWGPLNYADAYCTLDPEKFGDYYTFRATMKKNNLSPTTVLCLYTGEESFRTTKARSFYSGDFQIHNEDEADEALESLLTVNAKTKKLIAEKARVQTEYLSGLRELRMERRIESYSEVTDWMVHIATQGVSFPRDKGDFKNLFMTMARKRFTN
ncbi:MAG: hypothetical protein P8J32_04670 [bacterium]|nr:hypothetical protein [bacterium]